MTLLAWLFLIALSLPVSILEDFPGPPRPVGQNEYPTRPKPGNLDEYPAPPKPSALQLMTDDFPGPPRPRR